MHVTLIFLKLFQEHIHISKNFTAHGAIPQPELSNTFKSLGRWLSIIAPVGKLGRWKDACNCSILIMIGTVACFFHPFSV